MKTSEKIFAYPDKLKGSAIAYGLVISATVSILLLGVMQFVTSQIKYASHIETREKAFHIAEGGVYFYRWYLAHEIEGKNQQEIVDFWEGSPLGVSNAYIKDYLDNNGNKIGESEISVSFPLSNNYNIVEVSSVGKAISRPNVTRTIKIRLRRSIWSDFAYLSDASTCFDEAWTINGKIMSNEGVHFDGTANNTVLSGVSSYDDINPFHTYNDKNGVWTLSANPQSVFTAGTKFPVPKKDFNGVTASFQILREEAMEPGGATINDCTAAGCYFDNTGLGKRIILKDNDTFDICTVNQVGNGSNQNRPKKYSKTSGSGTCNDCSGDCLSSYSIPDEGVIFVEDNAWIEGTINGKRITLAAASVSDPANDANIYLGINNVKYTNTDGSDVIAMLSEGNIEILTSSSDDLEIDGALLTQNGELVKAEYNPVCCGDGCLLGKNQIDIFGSVISKNGIDFGFHKDCPLLNNKRKITYDNNLYLYPPPFFPADSFYFVDQWEEI